MSKRSEVSYLRPVESTYSKLPRTEATQAILNACYTGLKASLQGMFDAIDDSLFELANNARSNNEQNRFFEAMREIRIKRRNVESEFKANIERQFEPTSVLSPRKDNQNNNASQEEELSLVVDEVMETNVAITSMVSKARSNYYGQLTEIHHKFASLYEVDNPNSIFSPLDAEALCQAFSQSIECLEIDLNEKLLVLKQFDRQVMSQLNDVLQMTSMALSSQGASYNPKSATSNTSPTQNRSTPPASAKARKNDNTSQQVLPALQTLLNQRRSVSGTHQPGDGHVTLTGGELIELLSAAQTQILTELSQASQVSGKPFNIHEHLVKSASGKKASFSASDEDLINLVAMLFEFILEDYNLAPSMQALISRLQIPILKVVIRDESFFNSSNHPARTLLNKLAQAGIGWSETQSKTTDSLYQKIHEVVQTILREFDGDMSLFRKLQNEFSLYQDREERRTAIVEQRTRESEEGRIKTKQAHQKVDEILSKQILSAHHAIPDVIIETLRHGWSRVMFLAYLKDESEHQWKQTVERSKQLIWCLQPLSDPKDRQRWITIVPKLIKELEAGLASVSYNANNLDKTIEEIKHCLTQIFRESSSANVANSTKNEKLSKQIEMRVRNAQNRERTEEELSDTPAPDKRLLQLTKELELVSNLKPGQWVEFKLINGSNYRCKLSSHIPEADCYIFVNRMGLKPIEKSRLELAQELRMKKVSFLENGLIIDRALDAIASNLRNN